MYLRVLWFLKRTLDPLKISDWSNSWEKEREWEVRQKKGKGKMDLNLENSKGKQGKHKLTNCKGRR